jgi:16S rRNA (cytosine1402-N4)-methyltransferase
MPDPPPDASPSDAPQQVAHVPVLCNRVVEELRPSLRARAAAGEAPVYLDCTAGLGGHAVALARELVAETPGTCVLCDLDPRNLELAEAAVRGAAPQLDVVTLHANFVEAPRRLAERGLAASAVLADLGFASTQIDDPSRGLSFRRPGPLDMRYDPSRGGSAADLVNTLGEVELSELLRDFGEERAARRIAAAIVSERRRQRIDTTDRLADIVRAAIGGRRPRSKGGAGSTIDPATRTFQALRIAVNDELASLEALLEAVQRGAVSLRASPSAPTWLAPEARVGIIAFHSLEDRLVKRGFAAVAERDLATVRTRRPIEATVDEVAQNPRARSAKLRVLELSGFHSANDAIH